MDATGVNRTAVTDCDVARATDLGTDSATDCTAVRDGEIAITSDHGSDAPIVGVN
jgi:hypothetical protein